MKHIVVKALSVLSILAQAGVALANPFEPGWVLEAEQSALRFTSVKQGSIIETSSFATYTGVIDPTGRAEIKVLTDSVDTKIDLRNVRMRFLFFETFKYPEATVTLQLQEDMISDLPDIRRKVLTIPIDVTLLDTTQTIAAEFAVTLLSDDLVAVSSSTPITIALEDFNLNLGREKLEEAAGVSIVPSATVTFDFVFSRLPDAGGAALSATSTADGRQLARLSALETQGDFSRDECAGRFEILSRSGNIYFSTGSAQLRPESDAILESITDIIARCPDLRIEISGHTDSDGSSALNQRLSERRAGSVIAYFDENGISSDRLVAVGAGEENPVAPNDTAADKQKNRRIEFRLLN
ncbi:MAG: OmpA family protein [Pseudomonadota bacterium]